MKHFMIGVGIAISVCGITIAIMTGSFRIYENFTEINAHKYWHIGQLYKEYPSCSRFVKEITKDGMVTLSEYDQLVESINHYKQSKEKCKLYLLIDGVEFNANNE